MEQHVQAVLGQAGVRACKACSADRIASRRIRLRHGIRHAWWWRWLISGELFRVEH